MILRGDSPRALSRRAFWALVGLAALLLALAPRGARTEPPQDQSAPAAPQAEPAHPKPVQLQQKSVRAAHSGALAGKNLESCTKCHEVPEGFRPKAEQTDDWRKAHDEVVRLLDQVKRTEAALRKAEVNLNRILERKSGHPEGGATKQAPSPPRILLPNGLVLKSIGNAEKGSGASAKVVWELKNTGDEVVQISQIRSSWGGLSVTPTSLRLEPGQSRQLVARLDTSRFSGAKTFTLSVTFDKPRPSEFKLHLQGTGRGTEKATSTTEDILKQKLDRLERLEKGLDNLMHEVESLRRELRPPTPPTTKEDEARRGVEKDFAVAEYYRRAGARASAILYYEKVCRRSPSSPLAEKASARIKELQSKEK